MISHQYLFFRFSDFTLAGILINTYSFGIMTKILISLVCMTAVLYTVRSEAGKVLRQLGINVKFLA